MAFNDLKIPISIANRYHVLLVGPEGEIKQESISHNTVCQNMFSNDADYNGWGLWNLRNLQFGSGTGTPAISDTTLFKQLWGVAIQKVSHELKYPTSTIHMTFEVPANSSYVGTITELGLGDRAHLMTHALLSDAEGQPISIDKTDIDKLIVDVDLFITVTASEPIHLPDSVQNMDFVCNLRDRAANETGYCGGTMYSPYKNVELSTSIKAAQLNQHRQRKQAWSGADMPSSAYNTHYGAQLGACTFGGYNNRKMTLTTKRIAQDLKLTDDIYFKGLTILGWGYIPFPNHDVFPVYTIENIKIGVGDGETSIYKNPLAYFIPNTEEITVNGVLLTRDVDYTIEAHNNADMYVELSPCNEAIISGGYQAQCNYYPEAFRRSLSTGTDIPGWDARNCTHSINKDNPIFIDMLESVTCNAIRIPQFWGAGTYELFYSEDGEEYISVTTLSKPNTTAEVHTIFDSITARYWKLTTTTTNTGTNIGNFNQPKAYCAFLGYVGDGNITFTNPPAEDAEILMKVDMDLPYKNSNWVIDISAEFTI